MAKQQNMGSLIGALFNSVTPKSEDKKRAVKPKKNQTTKGEKSVTEPAQQHGELASNMQPKKLTDTQVLKGEARYQKRRATEDWVAGRIDSKQHTNIHSRANHVLAGKVPAEFKGTTGDKKGKGLW